MSTKAYELTQILETLTEEDYRAAIKYAEFLAASRKKNIRTTVKGIQKLLKDDKAWDSKEDMLADMAAFRRSRSV